MVGVSSRRGPGALCAALSELKVRVDSAEVEQSAVSLPDYPDGPRPNGVVRLAGKGCVGSGENVAFFATEQQRFADFVEMWFRSRAQNAELRVGNALGAEGTHYERSALEAALIDLGLRQAGLSLHDLTGVREASLRFVVSLAQNPDPLRVISELRAAGYVGDLKIDVDPSWSVATLEALARDPSIVTFDFKGRAEPALARQLASLSPDALFEDPPSGFEDLRTSEQPTRISRDAILSDEHAVARVRARGEAVNLKAPRMGGPLELLRGLAHALAPGPTRARGARFPAYLGGMFEVGVGRAQARQLAALYCGAAPNDLALNVARAEHSLRANSPATIYLDRPGFGSD
jgi:L-alanine-DL-glutamate epimerase-like enolase superfamily enzyme